MNKSAIWIIFHYCYSFLVEHDRIRLFGLLGWSVFIQVVRSHCGGKSVFFYLFFLRIRFFLDNFSFDFFYFLFVLSFWLCSFFNFFIVQFSLFARLFNSLAHRFFCFNWLLLWNFSVPINNCNLNLIIVVQHINDDLIFSEIATIFGKMSDCINMKEFRVIRKILRNNWFVFFEYYWEGFVNSEVWSQRHDESNICICDDDESKGVIRHQQLYFYI